MKSPRKRIELAIAQNLLMNPKIAGGKLADMQIMVSKDQRKQVTPRIEVLTQEINVTEGFDAADSAELSASVNVLVVTDADADNEQAEDIVESVTDALTDVSRAKQVMNKPSKGNDRRPIKDIYIYDITPSNQQEEVDERERMTVISCDVIFRASDG